MKKLAPKKTSTKVVAVVAGGVLVCAGLAGVTGATYSAEAPGTPGTVMAGSLNITNGTPGGWFDSKSGQAVDPGSFGITPSDALVRAEPVTIEVIGDNAAASLTAEMPSLTGELASDANGLYGNVVLVKGAYDPAAGAEVDPSTIVASTLLGGTTKHKGTQTDFAKGSGNGVYTVVTTLQVASNTKTPSPTSLGAVLDQTQFRLTQARPVDPATTEWIIPDPAFRALVISDLTQIGYDPATPLTLAVAQSLPFLQGDATGVTDLTGIEQATNLTYVNLSNAGALASVEPFSGLVKVEYVSLDGAVSVTDYSPFSGMPNMTSFNVRSNEPSNSPIGTLRFLAGNKALQSVDIYNATNLGTLDGLSDLTHLTQVSVRSSGVTDPSPLNSLRGASVSVTNFALEDAEKVDWSGSAELLANNTVEGDNIPADAIRYVAP